MISTRLLGPRFAARSRAFIQTNSRLPLTQFRLASNDSNVDIDLVDPNMNGGYVNPPRISRQMRDPHGNYWDKQERRNFGESVHEDNDILGVFSPEIHTHVTPGTAFFHLTCFVAAVLGLCGVVYQYYPDRPAAPRTFPGGLEAELGGTETVVARKHGEDNI